jgi:hypothetical protein
LKIFSQTVGSLPETPLYYKTYYGHNLQIFVIS